MAITVTELSPQTPVRPAPRGDPASRGRRPGPALVFSGSIALFAVLLAFLTYQLSSGRDPSLGGAVASRPVLVRQVIKSRVITTILPTPGRSSVSSSGPSVGSLSSSSAPVTTGAS